jgi:hypothetical protein
VLIVAEAMHDTAAHDVRELLNALAGELGALWGARVRSAVLTKDAPVFECHPGPPPMPDGRARNLGVRKSGADEPHAG